MADLAPQTEVKSYGVTVNSVGQDSHSSSDGGEPIYPDIQVGVQNVEAVTSVWSMRSLIVAYTMIWFIYFVDTLQAGATGSLVPYVTSAFAEHSLTPTVGIFSSIIGAVLQLTLAKILDVWGRPQGYLISVIIATLGLIMMAACNTVEMYAAAQVFYTLGNVGKWMSSPTWFSPKYQRS